MAAMNEAYLYCSPEEAAYRQQSGDVHVLEATDATRLLPVNRRVADPCRVVKKFVRSGSSDLHKSYAPRTLVQLQATVTYLLRTVWWVRRGDADALPVVYAFVADRVQAVRQDVITDEHFQAHPVAVVRLFEQLVRFYVDAMHVALGTVARAAAGAPPLSGWFDLHLHENALSSCIATCLGFCAQRPDLLGSAAARLAAYAALLAAARGLREAFHCVYAAAAPTAVAPPAAWLRVADVSSAKAAAPLTLLAHAPPALTAAAKQGAAEEEEGEDEDGRTRAVVACTLRCVGALRQMNPAGAVAALAPVLPRSLPPSSSSSSSSSSTSASSPTTSSGDEGGGDALVLAALLWHLLPELRLWRLLLMDTSAEARGEELPAAAAAARLWWGAGAGEGGGGVRSACAVVGVPCRDAAPGPPPSGPDGACVVLRAPAAAAPAPPVAPGKGGAGLGADAVLARRAALVAADFPRPGPGPAATAKAGAGRLDPAAMAAAVAGWDGDNHGAPCGGSGSGSGGGDTGVDPGPGGGAVRRARALLEAATAAHWFPSSI